MTGKNKCKILKDIRRQIAQNNDIELIIEECTYKGECRGTCPRCEAELRYLEAELLKRKNAGKNIAVAGLAALLLTSTACSPDTPRSHTASTDSTSPSFSSEGPTMGETPVIVSEPSDKSDSGYELEGDVAYPSSDPETEGSIPVPSSIYTSTGVESPNIPMGMPRRDDYSVETIPAPSSRYTYPERHAGNPPSDYNRYSVEIIPVAQNDDGPTMDINRLFELSSHEREEYYKSHTRGQVIKAWNEYDNIYSFETGDDKDIFLLKHEGKNYELIFSYDEKANVIELLIRDEAGKVIE